MPTLAGVEAPADATVALSSAAMTFTLPSIPAYVTNIKLVIQASEPQGNGITRAYSKAAAFALRTRLSPPPSTSRARTTPRTALRVRRSQGVLQVFLRK